MVVSWLTANTIGTRSQELYRNDDQKWTEIKSRTSENILIFSVALCFDSKDLSSELTKIGVSGLDSSA